MPVVHDEDEVDDVNLPSQPDESSIRNRYTSLDIHDTGVIDVQMLCKIPKVDLEQLSLHMLSHACSKQDTEPVVAEMFLQLLFCPSFDQLLDANTQFLTEQKLPCKNILTIFLETWIL